jgi:outer membrane protein OmpA-like peptidoglycan-associated protein
MVPQILYKGAFMGRSFSFLATVFAILLMSGCSNKGELETAQKEAQEKLEAEKMAEADRIAQEEADRLAAEKAEADRIAQEEADRLAAEKAEADRIAQEEADRLAAENAKAEERLETLLNAKQDATALKNSKIEQGKVSLSDEMKQSLHSTVTYLQLYPEATATINAYTDSTGSEEKNLELSTKRAELVRDYLIENGASADQITVNGFGETNFINGTDTNSPENRRVEIELN